MKSVIRSNLNQMTEYKPPLEGRSGHNYLLLDFNERTTPVAKHIKEALKSFIDSDRLQVYPEYGDILSQISDYVGVSANNLMITNGSDHGIDLIFRSCGETNDEAIIPIPSFPMFLQSAGVCGYTIKTAVYSRRNGYPVNQVQELLNEKTRLILICNPNSPTGTVLEVEKILAIAKSAPRAAILVDECYFEYCQVTIKDFVEEYPNLFVTRTFSKTWGLAALRIGYVISSAKNISELLKVRGPYDVNTLSVVALSAALKDPSYMKEYVEEVNTQSKPLFLSYLEEREIPYWPTAANFVLFYPPNVEELVNKLKFQNILVRPRQGPGIENSVRVTIGTLSDTKRLIAGLEKIL